MKKFKIISGLFISIFFFNYCAKTNHAKKEEDSIPYFLSDIRPRYFENLNFESEAIVSQIPSFLNDLAQSYNKLEKEYNAGSFKSSSDLENMRLVGIYYSFYLVGLASNYMDGNLTFANIFGNREKGFFSNLSPSEPDFEQKELNVMMERARQIAFLDMNINGYNDRAYGFYLIVRQAQERLKSRVYVNNPVTQDSTIKYSEQQINNYTLIPVWNILMSMVTFTNYADSTNSFKNPGMNSVLNSVNTRLYPGSLQDLGGRYPEILGPIYRFDLNLKKADWLLHRSEKLTEADINAIEGHITTLETSANYVIEKKKALLDSWIHKETFYQRLKKVDEMKNYLESISSGRSGLPKPALANYLNSKDFKKAYQCYSCHRPSGL